MVKIGSILSGFPPVGPASARLNWLLGQTRNSIRPRRVMLLDSMEMNGRVEGHVVMNNKLISVKTDPS